MAPGNNGSLFPDFSKVLCELEPSTNDDISCRSPYTDFAHCLSRNRNPIFNLSWKSVNSVRSRKHAFLTSPSPIARIVQISIFA